MTRLVILLRYAILKSFGIQVSYTTPLLVTAAVKKDESRSYFELQLVC